MKTFVIGLIVLSLGAFMPVTSFSADVDAFAECAYTADDLECYIYADINNNNLYSFGVTLMYDDSKLTVDESKTGTDKTVWYLGSEVYTDKYLSVAGKAVLVGGRLDEGAPTAGVGGLRVDLGKVYFDRDVPGVDPGADPATFFGIELALGNPDPYANFVDTAAPPDNVLDNQPGGVSFAWIVTERCDANASGGLTVRDISAVKTLLRNDDFRVYADCNASGSMTVRDISAVKTKLREQ